MFATFHVLGNMFRIWQRDMRSFCRNIFFMVLYFYMLLTTVLSFLLVGLFYAALSIFVREVLPSDECTSIKKAANIIEN